MLFLLLVMLAIATVAFGVGGGLVVACDDEKEQQLPLLWNGHLPQCPAACMC